MQKILIVGLCLLAKIVYGNGEVYTWGQNYCGQLGNDSTTASSSPVLVLGEAQGGTYLTNITTIAGVRASSFAIESGTGQLYAWGQNNKYQLGDGTPTEKHTPVQVQAYISYNTVPLTNVIAIDGGGDGASIFGVAVRSDGTVWSWGTCMGNTGVLGQGNSNQLSPIAQQVWANSGGTFLTGCKAVAAGYSHALALKSDGSAVYAWGENTYGELGNGNTTNSNYAVQVSGLTNVIAIGAGYWHSVALKLDGTVWVWGNCGYGEAGNHDSLKNFTTPQEVHGPNNVGYLTGISAIGNGSEGIFVMALKSDSTVWNWGNDGSGQLGNNTTGNFFTTPVQVHGVGDVGYLTGITAISATLAGGVALKSDSTVYQWGGGQLVPVQVPGVGGIGYLTGITAINGGYDHVLAIGYNVPAGTEFIDNSAKSIDLSVAPGVGNKFSIKYTLPGNISNYQTSLKLYDIAGNVIKVLFNGIREYGSYTMDLDLSIYHYGIYFLRLEAGNKHCVRKLTVISK